MNNTMLRVFSEQLAPLGCRVSNRFKLEGITRRGLSIFGGRFGGPIFIDTRESFGGHFYQDDVDEIVWHVKVAIEMQRRGWRAQVEADDYNTLELVVYDAQNQTRIDAFMLGPKLESKDGVDKQADGIVKDLIDGCHGSQCIGLEDTATGDLFVPTSETTMESDDECDYCRGTGKYTLAEDGKEPVEHVCECSLETDGSDEPDAFMPE